MCLTPAPYHHLETSSNSSDSTMIGPIYFSKFMIIELREKELL